MTIKKRPAAKKAKPARAETPSTKQKPGPEPVAQNLLDEAGTQAICDMIVDGKTYREISRQFNVGLATLNRWMEADPERSQACARAREQAAQTFDERALDGIDQADDNFKLAKAREAAIHLRWRAKAVNPRRYGEKVAVGGADDLPPIRKALDLTGLSTEELAQFETLARKAAEAVTPAAS